jgi:hypothetical protein
VRSTEGGVRVNDPLSRTRVANASSEKQAGTFALPPRTTALHSVGGGDTLSISICGRACSYPALFLIEAIAENPPMLPEQSRSRRSRVFTGIFVAIMAIAGIAVTESAHPARATVRVGALSASNASISAEPIDVTSTCSAEISGAWSGTLAFQVRRPGGNAESATAQSFSGAPAGPTTRRSGIFL